jgi:hypothetical protein
MLVTQSLECSLSGIVKKNFSPEQGWRRGHSLLRSVVYLHLSPLPRGGCVPREGWGYGMGVRGGYGEREGWAGGGEEGSGQDIKVEANETIHSTTGGGGGDCQLS